MTVHSEVFLCDFDHFPEFFEVVSSFAGDVSEHHIFVEFSGFFGVWLFFFEEADSGHEAFLALFYPLEFSLHFFYLIFIGVGLCSESLYYVFGFMQ